MSVQWFLVELMGGIISAMDLEPQEILTLSNETPENPTEIGAETANTPRTSLEILRDTEAALRRPVVAMITPIIPPPLCEKITTISQQADQTLNQLAAIDINSISDWELRPARISIGLSFVGFAALSSIFLILYLQTLDSGLNQSVQIGKYWYQYVSCVNLGVTGMFLLGREAMRTPKRKPKPKRRDYSYLKDKFSP